MRHNTDNTIFALTRVLSTINKSVRQDKVKKFKFNGVNLNSAEALYHSINYKQKGLLRQIGTSVSTSAEYNFSDVLTYSVLRWYNTGGEWIFDEENYTTLKNNFIIINKNFQTNSYINIIKKLQEDLKNGIFKAKDLVNIGHDGESVLFKMFKSGNWPVPVLLELLDLYALVDTDEESVDHQRFRKMLHLLYGIKTNHKKNKLFY